MVVVVVVVVVAVMMMVMVMTMMIAVVVAAVVAVHREGLWMMTVARHAICHGKCMILIHSI